MTTKPVTAEPTTPLDCPRSRALELDCVYRTLSTHITANQPCCNTNYAQNHPTVHNMDQVPRRQADHSGCSA